MRKTLKNKTFLTMVLLAIAISITFAGDVIVQEGEITGRRAAFGDGVEAQSNTLLQLGNINIDTGDNRAIMAAINSDQFFTSALDFDLISTADSTSVVRGIYVKAGYDYSSANLSRIAAGYLVVNGAGTVGNNTIIEAGNYQWTGLEILFRNADSGSNKPSGGNFNFVGLKIQDAPAHYDEADSFSYKAIVAEGDVEINNADLSVTGKVTMDKLVIPSGEEPPTTDNEVGELFLDTDAGTNGTLKIYSNGAWRTVAEL